MKICRCFPFVLLLAVGVSAVGCGSESDNQPSGNGASKSSAAGKPPAIPAAIQAGKVELRVGKGEKLYSFKPAGSDSARFYDKNGNELCKLTFVDGKLKVKRPDGRPLFELKRKADKVMIKDAAGEKELFKFKLKGGNIDFYAPGDMRLNRIRKKDYGYSLEDNSGVTLFRAKTKDKRVVLRDAKDVTVLYSNDLRNPLGLVFFRIAALSIEQQAACLVFFLE